MNIALWCRSLMYGWRMFAGYSRNLRSLRTLRLPLGVPAHRLSADELDASVGKFAWLARLNGLSEAQVASAVRHIREAMLAARAEHRTTELHPQ